MEILSSQNPQVKEVIALRQRRVRDQTKRFLIEGYRELIRAVEGGIQCQRVYYCPELFLGKNEQALLARSGARAIPCSKSAFCRMSYRDRPDGLLAIAPHPQISLEAVSGELFVVAEAIEKPGNLGTILRSADATGVDAVLVCDPCTDLYNPNVVRASVGTLFTVPTIQTSMEATVSWLTSRDVRFLAATPEASTIYSDADLTGPLAIAVGTEQYGLSIALKRAAQLSVRLPMCGVADSLNVATATTVLLYEALRQRCR